MNDDKQIQDDDLLPIEQFYTEAEEYGFNKRTLQWYVTEGIIPRAIHIGKEAYYKLSECPIYEYLHIISILKEDRVTLRDIGDVLNNYKKNKHEIELLSQLLTAMAEDYPIKKPIKDPPGPRKMSHSHQLNRNTARLVRGKVYDKIVKGEPIGMIRLTEIQREVEMKGHW